MKDKKYTEPTKAVVADEFEQMAIAEKEEEVKQSFHEYKAEATIPKLQVREEPNSEAESIDTISFGQSVTIVEEKDGWGKTKYGKGWVNLKYTRRV